MPSFGITICAKLYYLKNRMVDFLLPLLLLLLLLLLSNKFGHIIKLNITLTFFKLQLPNFCMVIDLDNTQVVMSRSIQFCVIPYYTKYPIIQNSSNSAVFKASISNFLYGRLHIHRLLNIPHNSIYQYTISY